MNLNLIYNAKKMKTNKYLFGLLWGLFLLGLPCESALAAKKTTTPAFYDKLFKGKPVEKAAGDFANVYRLENKVYLELPVQKLGKELLLSSTISSVSESTVLTVGMRSTDPLYIRFVLQDSMLVMKSVNSMLLFDKQNQEQQRTVDANFLEPVIASFRIEGYGDNKKTVVLDFSRFVAATNDFISIVPKQMGNYTLSASPKSNLIFVRKVKAFRTNISVQTDFSYSLSGSLMKMIPIFSDLPVTVGVTFNLMELPESDMRPRIADARVGVGYSRKMSLPKGEEGIKSVYYAHRWNIVPEDMEAFRAGKLTEPKQPIVYYIDPTFPEAWKQPIRNGVLRWNKAFEKIGFKNVLQVRDFPTGNPDFDPDNFEFTCIRYIPSNVESALGKAWVNPATGEILNASIAIYHNLPELIRQWLFVQTANVDPRVRSLNSPQELMDEAMSYIVAHEVGITLGLVENYAASSAFPTQSLRSADFTQKYGTTPSIMDYARYNYVAQPEDKGVRLSPPELGIYDYYVIDWNYRYFGDEVSDTEQTRTLEKFVDKQLQNPYYRYAPQTNYDPSVQSDDLGNDPILSAQLGAKNLKNISKNLGGWIRNDDDSQIKTKYDLLVAQQLHRYFKYVIAQVGGIYLNQSKEGSSMPRYKVVAKDVQRKSLVWAVNFIKDFPNYANRQLEHKGYVAVSVYDQLIEYLVGDLFRQRNKVLVSSYMDPKSYAQKDFYNDLFNEIFRNAAAGKQLTAPERFMQKYMIDMGVAALSSKKGGAPAPNANPNGFVGNYFSILARSGQALPIEQWGGLELVDKGFGDPSSTLLPNVNVRQLDNSEMYLLDILQRAEPILQRAYTAGKNQETKAHYALLLRKLKNALKDKND